MRKRTGSAEPAVTEMAARDQKIRYGEVWRSGRNERGCSEEIFQNSRG